MTARPDDRLARPSSRAGDRPATAARLAHRAAGALRTSATARANNSAAALASGSSLAARPDDSLADGARLQRQLVELAPQTTDAVGNLLEHTALNHDAPRVLANLLRIVLGVADCIFDKSACAPDACANFGCPAGVRLQVQMMS